MSTETNKKKADKSDKIALYIQRTLCYIVLILLSILCLFSFYVLLINTTRSHPDIQKGFSLIPGKSFLVNLKNLLTDSFSLKKNTCYALQMIMVTITGKASAWQVFIRYYDCLPES